MSTATQLIPDPHSLPLLTRVNGELRQDSNTSDMIVKIPEIIEFCSQGTTLQAGSVILTGTPSGVGYAMKPPRWLQPGDQIEITVGPMTLIHGIKYV
jgi:2-keto-4-pentenoate hydratase/2-oxohepta-3-ene-1,7-dioic acid hydratase in catechol pathway